MDILIGPILNLYNALESNCNFDHINPPSPSSWTVFSFPCISFYLLTQLIVVLLVYIFYLYSQVEVLDFLRHLVMGFIFNISLLTFIICIQECHGILHINFAVLNFTKQIDCMQKVVFFFLSLWNFLNIVLDHPQKSVLITFWRHILSPTHFEMQQ